MNALILPSVRKACTLRSTPVRGNFNRYDDRRPGTHPRRFVLKSTNRLILLSLWDFFSRAHPVPTPLSLPTRLHWSVRKRTHRTWKEKAASDEQQLSQHTNRYRKLGKHVRNENFFSPSA